VARKRAAAAVLGLLLAASWLFASAVRPAAEQEKIDFLLAEVKRSDDVFIRNGSEYSGAKASAHLAVKLRFAGKRVQTATD
jgi:hypothetical protein